jgi:lactoylglutathione lyase
MRVEHLAIWVEDLELMKEFYLKYFGAKANDRYYNPKKEFESYFLTFDSGARIELMHKPKLELLADPYDRRAGYAHMAIALGSAEEVDNLTERMRTDGYTIVGKPRTTGDGYYESVIIDPEGNRIELTV